MKIKFNIDISDYQTHARVSNKENKIYKNSLRWKRLIISSIFLLTFAVLAVYLKNTLLLYIGLCYFIVTLIFYPLIFLPILSLKKIKSIYELHNVPVNNEVELEIETAELVVRSNLQVSRYKYEVFYQMREYSKNVYLDINPMSSIIIPTKKIIEGDLKSFLNDLRTKINNQE
ncbi:MAG: YcxB family protein [Spirochaetes bacterium]|nr:YcxB family protein [Spirochaetota bacterium]